MIIIIVVILITLVVIICYFCYVCYIHKNCKNNQNNQNNRIISTASEIRPNIIKINKINNDNESESSIINKRSTFDECHIYRKKLKFHLIRCKICNLHQINNNKCPNCNNNINNKEKIQSECGICLEKNKKLNHFSCGCAFLVCDNYYKKVMENQNLEERRCPGCRIKI